LVATVGALCAREVVGLQCCNYLNSQLRSFSQCSE